MHDRDIDHIMKTLSRVVKTFGLPLVTEVSLETNKDAYKILISTMLSLRSKDTTTREASRRLFAKAPTPKTMLKLSKKEIESLIYPVGFYHTKAENLLHTSRDLLERFNGEVPQTIDELLTLKGVGRKTANLVVTEAFDKAGICVDTHVHRISNRLGYVHTKMPEETEWALREKLPKKYWRRYNDTLVMYGQNLCRPINPHCERCEIKAYCDYGQSQKK